MLANHLRDLLLRPPHNRAELDVRLRELSVTPAELRQAMAAWIEHGDLEDAAPEGARALLSVLGVGDDLPLFRGLVSRRELARERRRMALWAITSDPARGPAVLSSLGPDLVRELAADDWRAVLRGTSSDPEAAKLVAASILGAPKAAREAVWALWEELRPATGVSAVRAYEQVLRSEPLAALHKHVTRVVVEESRYEDVALLEALVASPLRRPVRQELQQALREARTKSGAVSPGGPQATVSVGACDGQGAFVVLASFEVTRGRYDAAALCIRASEDFRDGLVEVDRSRHQVAKLFDEMQARLGAQLAFVRAPVGEVAFVIEEALERTRGLGRAVPAGLACGVELLRSAGPQRPAADALLDGARAADASLDRAMSALCAGVHAWWFFDAGDLSAAGVHLRSAGESVEAWCARSVGDVWRSRLRPRTREMARMMMRWHAWNGDGETAAFFAAAVRSLEEGRDDNPLLRAMLHKTAAAADARAGMERGVPTEVIGDRARRAYLRSKIRGAAEPQQLDLMALDLAEVGYAAVSSNVHRMPGHQRPRSDQIDALAVSFGVSQARALRAFALHPEGGATHEADRETAKLSAEWAKITGLERRGYEPLLACAIEEMVRFLDGVCSVCPLQCMTEAVPAEDAARGFYQDHHPAGDRLVRVFNRV